MKRKLLLGITIIGLLSMTVAILKLESKKETPALRNKTEASAMSTPTTTEEDKAPVTSDEDEAENITEPSEKQTEHVTYYVRNGNMLKYKLLSYELIDDTDIENQDRYKAEYFYEGKLPDSSYTTEVTDYDAVFSEAPEYADLCDNPGKYTENEADNIKSKYQDIIEKYTTYEHPKTKYLFVTCEVTNMNDTATNEYLELYDVATTPDHEKFAYSSLLCYFDQSTHLEGDDRIHEYFNHTFEPNETLTCVLGLLVQETFPNEELYVGIIPAGYNEETNLIYEDGIISLKDLEITK